MNAPTFKRGDRVRWSRKYLAANRHLDPRWYREQMNACGTVDVVESTGDLLVAWHDRNGNPMYHETGRHAPERLERVALEIVVVYDGPQRVALIESDARTAWRSALTYMRRLAHAAGYSAPVTWGRTANRPVAMLGWFFRCLPLRAEQRS